MVSRNYSAEAQGKVLKFGLIIDFSHSAISNLKQRETKHQRTKSKPTQIQNLHDNKKNSGTSVLLWYTPKIKYPNSIYGSSYMTKPPRDKEL